MALLGGDGFTAYAPDWVGHGDTEKPQSGAFGYTEQEYIDALDAFVEASGIKKPFALVVQVRRQAGKWNPHAGVSDLPVLICCGGTMQRFYNCTVDSQTLLIPLIYNAAVILQPCSN
jgi:hypothetical protein